MPRAMKNAFAMGEIKPSLRGMVNTELFGQALARCQDALPIHGVTNRSGSLHADQIAAESVCRDNRVTTIPFIASSKDRYLLCFYVAYNDRLYMRVMYNGAFLAINGAASTLDVMGGGATWTSDYCRTIKYAQVADELTISIAGNPLYRITRTAHTTWGSSKVDLTGVTPPTLDSGGATNVRNIAVSTSEDIDAGFWITRVVDGMEHAHHYSDEQNPITCRIPWDFDGEHVYLIWNAVRDSWTYTGGIYQHNDPLSVGMAEPDRVYVLTDTGSGIKPVPLDKAISLVACQATALTWYWYDMSGVWAGRQSIAVNYGPNPSTALAVVFTYDNTFWKVYGNIGNVSTEVEKQGFIETRNLPYIVFTGEPLVNYGQHPYTMNLGINEDSDNYPEALAITQQRAWYANAPDWPNGLKGSRLGDLDHFGFNSPLLTDDAIDQTIASEQVNGIVHIMPHRNGLLLFTSGDIWRTTTTTGALTWDAMGFDRLCKAYPSNVRPLEIDDRIIFCDTTGRVLELQYEQEGEAWVLIDRNEHAAHLFDGVTIVKWAWQGNPGRTIWCAMSDGTMRTCTISPDFTLWGWAPHDVSGFITDVSVLGREATGHAGAYGVRDEDEVWIAVHREGHTGATAQDGVNLEQIPFHREEGNTTANAQFLDAGMAQTAGSPTTSWSGFDHLAGTTVNVMADGMLIEDVEVSAAGEITLAEPASTVYAGHPIEAIVEMLAITEAPSTNKHMGSMVVRLRETAGLEIGPTEDHLIAMLERSTEPYDAPANLFTGRQRIELRQKWTKDGQAVFRQRKPLPFAIEAVIPQYSKGT